MAEKYMNGRAVQKHDTEVNWNKATNFIPMKGEIIVYDTDENYSYERFKIGDGQNNVTELDFTTIHPDEFKAHEKNIITKLEDNSDFEQIHTTFNEITNNEIDTICAIVEVSE